MVFLQVTHVNYLTPEKIVNMPVVAPRHDKSHKNFTYKNLSLIMLNLWIYIFLNPI